MSIFGSIMEKLGMGRHKPAPDIRPLPGHNQAHPLPTGAAPQPPGSPAPAPAAAPVAPTPISEVDVEAKLESLAHASAQKLNWRTSIVDLMKLLGMDSSLAERKELASELGCPPDKMADSAQMNMWLHAAVLRKLAANGGKVPRELLD